MSERLAGIDLMKMLNDAAWDAYEDESLDADHGLTERVVDTVIALLREHTKDGSTQVLLGGGAVSSWHIDPETGCQHADEPVGGCPCTPITSVWAFPTQHGTPDHQKAEAVARQK